MESQRRGCALDMLRPVTGLIDTRMVRSPRHSDANGVRIVFMTPFELRGLCLL